MQYTERHRSADFRRFKATEYRRPRESSQEVRLKSENQLLQARGTQLQRACKSRRSSTYVLETGEGGGHTNGTTLSMRSTQSG